MNALTLRPPPSAPPVAFSEHPRFHRIVGRAAAAGSIAGLGTWVASLLSGGTVDFFAPVVVAVAVGAVVDRFWPVVLAAAALGTGVGLLPAALPAHAPFALLSVGGVLGWLALGRRPVAGGPKSGRVLSALGCALSTLVGAWAVGRIAGHGVLDAALPGPLPLMGYGAALGLFTTLGASAAHVTIGPDPVERAAARARRVLEAPYLGLLERGVSVYRAAKEALLASGDEESTRDLRGRLESVGLHLVHLAERCHQVDEALGADTDLRLAEQLDELSQRMEATHDDMARRSYELAHRTLAEQAEQVERIRNGRDRVVASLHGQIALLERTRLSLVALRSSDSSRMAGELALVSDVLADAAREMEAESQAVMELEAGVDGVDDYGRLGF